ncbi:MAG TPA: hypothetical protein VGG74_19355 [Kofleriaceae bacterium]|jgi:hypothetical protein
MTKALLLAGAVVMGALSFIGYTHVGLFWIAGGSDALFRVARLTGGEAVVVYVCVMFAAALCALRLRHRWLSRIGLVLLLLFWGICGRWVGVFADGRTSAGWYVFETQTITLNVPEEDWDLFFASTTWERTPLGCLRLVHNERNASMFVGPIVMNRTLDLLKESGMHALTR